MKQKRNNHKKNIQKKFFFVGKTSSSWTTNNICRHSQELFFHIPVLRISGKAVSLQMQ